MAAFGSLLPLRKRPTSQFCIATPRRRGRNPKQTQLPKRRVELIGCSLPNPSSAKSLLKLVVLSGRASWGRFFGGTKVRPPNPPFEKGGLSGEHECSTRTSILEPKLGPDELRQSISYPYRADKKIQF